MAGCGGGDGGGDTIAPEPDTGVTQPGTGGGNNGGNPTVPIEALNIISSQLVNADGESVNSIDLQGAYYEVIVTNNNNQPLANVKVSFSIDADGIALSQTTSGSTLTDTDGRARIFLKPNAPDVSGAYTITANASNDNNTAIDNFTFSVQTTAVRISQLSFDKTSLESGGETKVTFNVSDTAGNALSGVMVDLAADCGQLPEQVTSDSNGAVEFTYRGINEDNTLCSDMVRISATTGNSTQSSNIMIEASQANSIVYTSNELTLGIQNSGSSRTGAVEFTVYANNVPVPNAEVILSLEKAPLGLSFGTLDNRADFRARTDNEGKVSVEIYPGSTPGPVEIEATLASDSRINGLSKNISIASSRVTQTGLSLSWEKNVLDWSMDGDTSGITARMVDRNGNAVPDGTVINFTAEGGKVTSSCPTINGVCSVTFSTQNPRPGDGRVSILAVAEGEKDYIDLNQNNAFDQCEVVREENGVKIYETPSATTCDVLVHNIGDTFRDDNENGDYEVGEFTYPLTTSANGSCENNLDRYIKLKFPSLSELKKLQYKANYIGEFVSPNKDDTCNNGLDAVVRYQGITLLANKDAKFTIVAPQLNTQTQNIYSNNSLIRFRINSDGFYDLNPMPSGTTISATATDNTDSSSVEVRVDNAGRPNVYKITFTGGTPGGTLQFTVDDEQYSATDTNGDGVYVFEELERSTPLAVADIQVDSEEGSCSAELSSGLREVPANVFTGTPGDNLGTISTFKLKDCSAGDEFTIIATTPNGNVTRLTYPIVSPL
ncbi:Ig-like domain-containing protein [Psychrobacter sp. 1Y11]|uniref:Ig-like domain-containing protein n=1 Tax=Psychrobacter sp. 1Y11 TaxID=3457446 RepID=UPI003FD1A86F